MEKLRVLHIASWYPNRVHPTNGNFVEKHIRAVSPFCRNVVIHLQEDRTLPWGRVEVDRAEEARGAIFRIYYGGGSTGWGKLASFAAYAVALRKTWQLLTREILPVRLVHVHVALYGGILALLLKQYKRLPYVVTEHASVYLPESPHRLGYFQRWLARRIFHSAVAVLPVSSHLARHLPLRTGHPPVIVIPNTVNADLFRPGEQNRGRGQDKIRFLHISNFHARAKNIAGLLEAAALLSQKTRDFELTIAGDGELSYVRRLMQPYPDLSELVRLHGAMSEAEVAKMMAQHDVFVLFSNYENLPCVLAEAQVAGLPCIATRVGGVQEIIKNTDLGLLVECRYPHQLSRAMAHMLENIGCFDSVHIRNHGKSRFDEKIVGSQIFAAYKQGLKLL